MGVPTATVRMRGPDGIARTATGMGTGPVDAAYKAVDALVRVQARPLIILELSPHVHSAQCLRASAPSIPPCHALPSGAILKTSWAPGPSTPPTRPSTPSSACRRALPPCMHTVPSVPKTLTP